LPAGDSAEVFVRGDLPPLPLISTSEDDELTAESEQPTHCGERDWNLLLPPWTYYFEYIVHVKFCRSCDQDGNTTSAQFSSSIALKTTEPSDTSSICTSIFSLTSTCYVRTEKQGSQP
jgi:hypothetical protein